MNDGFVNYWENILNNQPESPEYIFAKKMVDMPKAAKKLMKWQEKYLKRAAPSMASLEKYRVGCMVADLRIWTVIVGTCCI
jgi:hypothetical protein